MKTRAPDRGRDLSVERAIADAAGTVRTERVIVPVSYTHLRAHETPEHLVCRLLLEKKNN